jgi:hypothetical protein
MGPSSVVLVAAVLAAAPCKEQVAGLKKYLEPYLGLVGKGALSGPAGIRGDLPELPVGETRPPANPAATVEVRKAGFTVDGKPAAGGVEVRHLLAKNPNIAFAHGNPQAIMRGVIVAATREAKPADVRLAIEAAYSLNERVWLLFSPPQASFVEPGPSPADARLSAVAPGDAVALVQVIRVEAQGCSEVQTLFGELASEGSASGRAKAILTRVPPALERCACKASPASWGAILWHLNLRDLVFAVEVKKDALAAPAWTAAGTWALAAPKVLEAASAK